MLFRPEYCESQILGNKRLEDILAIGEHPADCFVGMQERFIAGLAADNRKLAGPGEFCVVRIDGGFLCLLLIWGSESLMVQDLIAEETGEEY